MSKKKFEKGDRVKFYHPECPNEKVEGTVSEMTTNNIVNVIFIHPYEGYQLWGIHTSALEKIEENK